MSSTNPRIEDTTPTPRVALGVMFAVVDLPASEHRRSIVTALRRRGAFLRRCRLFVLKVDFREAFTRGGQPCTPTKGRIQNTPKSDFGWVSRDVAFSDVVPVDQRTACQPVRSREDGKRSIIRAMKRDAKGVRPRDDIWLVYHDNPTGFEHRSADAGGIQAI